jgi:hypothetical protein
VSETELIAHLRAEAESCRDSAQYNGEYNAALYAMSVMLESLAQRIEAKSLSPKDKP